MEETIGECTNLHITYPAMVFGYMFVIRANRLVVAIASELAPETNSPVRQLLANDIAVQEGGEPVESIFRFHSALRELTGRRGIRNDVSRYEAVALAMIETTGDQAGEVLPQWSYRSICVQNERVFSIEQQVINDKPRQQCFAIAAGV